MRKATSIQRLTGELIITIEKGDRRQLISKLQAEAEQQAKKEGVQLSIQENKKTIAFTYRGNDQAIQKVRDFYIEK